MQHYYLLTHFTTADSFETATIDHQSLADYFSSKRKQQHAIDADHNQQIHHSIKLLNGPPKVVPAQDSVPSTMALSLVKNNLELGNTAKKDGARYNLRNKKCQ